jgi:imidazolonepropionase-like amidohydrolase
MAASGQVLVPTLSCFYGVAGLDDAVGTGESLVDPAGAADPAPFMPKAGAPPCWSPLLVELAQYNLAQADLTLRAAKAAGVRIAAGHDWHPFWDHALELRRMIAHGLTVAEALSAATAGAAHALGIDAHVGTVQSGRLADVLVVDGDPVADPTLLSARDRIWLVLQGGTAVAGAALQRDL